MADPETTPPRWIGWVLRLHGWVAVCSSDSYADTWGELRAKHPELNARLVVLDSGLDPEDEE